MTKADLILKVHKNNDCTLKTIEAIVGDVFKSIFDELAAGGEVKILGFGTFRVTERPARRGRNPRTGEEIIIPASRHVHFAQGKALKNAVKS